MKIISGILLTISVALLFSGEALARKQRTTRSNVNAGSTPSSQLAQQADSLIIPDSTQVMLYGYDKPLRSRRETVFVSNNTDFDINALSITTQYIDSKGRQFHESTRRINAEIPAGSTRRLDYPSWDTQQSFYYVGSKRSRVSGTPYMVRQSVDTIFVSSSLNHR